MSNTCVFCSIIQEDIPATIIAQNDQVLVIQDQAPKAPVHYLIMPKKHIVNLNDITVDDQQLMGQLMLMAQQVAQDLPEPHDFGLIINNGPSAGQSVFHLHCHFLAGKKMTDL